MSRIIAHFSFKEGITTDDIDAFVHDKVIKAGAYPSPLRYAGFPKSVCTSVNNVACHGIPDDRKLISGDIVNIDVTVFFNGYHGDCSKTFLVGDVDAKGRFLVESTEECVYKAIELCRPGQPFKAIGQFIERFAHERKLEPIPAYIGHGIGSYFHGPPEIYHFGKFGALSKLAVNEICFQITICPEKWSRTSPSQLNQS